jgi:hypothetical protein
MAFAGTSSDVVSKGTTKSCGTDLNKMHEIKSCFKFWADKNKAVEKVSEMEQKIMKLEREMLDKINPADVETLQHTFARLSEDQKQLKDFTLNLIEHCEAFEDALTRVESTNAHLLQRVSKLESKFSLLAVEKEEIERRSAPPPPHQLCQFPCGAASRSSSPASPLPMSDPPWSYTYWGPSSTSSPRYSKDGQQIGFPVPCSVSSTYIPTWPVDTSIPLPPILRPPAGDHSTISTSYRFFTYSIKREA